MMEIRQFPKAEPRVESGPVVFGDDWPGVFLRGDTAFGYYLALEVALAAFETSKDGQTLALTVGQLRGLQELLRQSNLVQRNAEPQSERIGEKHE